MSANIVDYGRNLDELHYLGRRNAVVRAVFNKTWRMNFLSHFYFERFSRNPELVVGSVLPDLLKNSRRGSQIHPRKRPERFTDHPKIQSIYAGWERHMEADRIFHMTDFFYQHTHELKERLAPIIVTTPIRPSFFSHIALELLLDHLLLADGRVHERVFYELLAAADKDAIAKFLARGGVTDTGVFFRFFNSFLRSQYVGSYRNFGQIVFALIEICRRLWPVHLTPDQEKAVRQELEEYAAVLAPVYSQVFGDIHPQLPVA